MDDSGSDSKFQIPQHEIEALARCLLPDIIEYFSSPEGKKEFEEWKAKQEGNKKKQFILHINKNLKHNKKARSDDLAFSPLKDKPKFQIHHRWVPGSDYPC